MTRNKERKAAVAIGVAAAVVLGLIFAAPAFSTRGPVAPTQTTTMSKETSVSSSADLSADASSTNKDFYIFTTEVEGVNETKLGLSGDVYSLQTMVVHQGDHVTVHFYNLESDKDEMHSFTIGAPYNINKDLQGGENATVSFVADHKGIFLYHCIHHPPEMTGQLVVLPSTTHKVNTNVQVEIEPQVTKIVNHITTVSPQVNVVNIKQVVNQLAIQVVNFGGNGSLVVNQVANQVAAENGNGNVSQFVKQLAEQQASGNTQSVNQTITQIAKQVVNGNEGNVVQVIEQTSIQEATNTTSVVPSQSTNQTATQSANQTVNTTTPSINGSNQTTTTNNTSTSPSNPLADLLKLFGFK
jgi:plastocyanin/ArsR family metal-binding transcriptional regulator